MRTRTEICSIALTLLLSAASIVLGGGPAPLRNGTRQRQAPEGEKHERRRCSCENCRVEMRTVQRLVYEPVEEMRQTTVYDLVWDQETIHGTQRCLVMQQREVPYTYYRTILEAHTREVSYTTFRPFAETHTRKVPYLTCVPVSETRTVTIPYTVSRTVEEQRTRTVYRSVPRQITFSRTVHVQTGHWATRAADDSENSFQKAAQKANGACERVWVPCIEERQIAQTRTVYDLKACVVPYTVTRTVPVTLTREVTRTFTRMVPMRQTRLVYYQVMRNIPEQHVRTVPYVVRRQVPETRCRVVPFPVYQDVPVTRVVVVPRRVPRTVCYKVTRVVPRMECVQVPVEVCARPGKTDDSKQKAHHGKVTDATPSPRWTSAADVAELENPGRRVMSPSAIRG